MHSLKRSSSSTPPTPSFATHPTSPPFHIIPSLSNFRTIGGWPISTATHVRHNLIYRGSDTTHITPSGILALMALNIRTDFDIRSASQVAKLGYRDLSEWGITRIWCPVFSEENQGDAERRYELYASEDVGDIVSAFIEILVSGKEIMARVLRHLIESAASSESFPALFIHCTTGNNRTGVFIALLLLLLNVPVDCVVREYTLSEFGLAETRPINVERLLRKSAFKEYGEVEARRKCERMVGARAESMEGLVQEVNRRWAGAEGYFLNMVALTREEIEKVRGILTAEGKGELCHSTDNSVAVL